MAHVSISEAADRFGIPKSTIYKKLETGELSAKKIDGKRCLDPSEVERVFPSDRPRYRKKDSNGIENSQVENLVKFKDLERDRDVLKMEVGILRDSNRQLTSQVDFLQKQLVESMATVKLIGDQRKSDEVPRKRIFQRIFGRKAA